jgi:hypothetical protein
LTALRSPYSRLITASIIFKKSAATPFREPLHFIVISVMGVIGGTFPHTYGVIYMTVKDEGFGDRHVIVMVSVMEK